MEISVISTARRTVRLLTAAGLIAGLLYGCQTNPARNETVVLSVDEVRRLFVGNTVESFNLNTRLTSFTYYSPNGRAAQERLWAQRKGIWSIQEDGKICLAFGKGKLKCRHIVKKDGRYYKIRPDKAGKPETVVRYRYFAAGNALTGR